MSDNHSTILHTDPIAIRTNTPRFTPFLSGPAGNLHHTHVHAVRGSVVDTTMVAGSIDVDVGKLLTANIQELITNTNNAVPELFRWRAEWLAAHRPVNALCAED